MPKNQKNYVKKNISKESVLQNYFLEFFQNLSTFQAFGNVKKSIF